MTSDPVNRAEAATEYAMRVGMIEWHVREGTRDIRRRERIEEIKARPDVKNSLTTTIPVEIRRESVYIQPRRRTYHSEPMS